MQANETNENAATARQIAAEMDGELSDAETLLTMAIGFVAQRSGLDRTRAVCALAMATAALALDHPDECEALSSEMIASLGRMGIGPANDVGPRLDPELMDDVELGIAPSTRGDEPTRDLGPVCKVCGQPQSAHVRPHF